MPGLTFLGAAGGVSGSRHLVDAAGGRVLIDCGLFQGEKNLRDKNWDRFPVRPDSINAVVLTHGHIDHMFLAAEFHIGDLRHLRPRCLFRCADIGHGRRLCQTPP